MVGLGDADLEAICAAVRAAQPDAVCQLANFLFPQGRVVSGGWVGGWVGEGEGCAQLNPPLFTVADDKL